MPTVTERRNEIGVGILLVASFALLAFLALKMGAIGDLGPRVDVVLRIDDAAGLDPGAEVSVAGVKVGEVSSLAVEGGKALAHLSLDARQQIRRDVVVAVRARSILGEKYVQLTPVSADAPALVDGDELALVGDQVEIDELLGLLGKVVDGVDPEKFGEAITLFVDAVRADPERLDRMLTNADTTLDNAAKASEALPALVDDAGATLDRADRALAKLDARLAEARSPIARADSVLAELEAAPIDETVVDARQTLADARAAIADARGALDQVDGVGPDLKRVLANFAEIDKWEIRRLLREEGILIRLRPHAVTPGQPDTPRRK